MDGTKGMDRPPAHARSHIPSGQAPPPAGTAGFALASVALSSTRDPLSTTTTTMYVSAIARNTYTLRPAWVHDPVHDPSTIQFRLSTHFQADARHFAYVSLWPEVEELRFHAGPQNRECCTPTTIATATVEAQT